MLYTCLSAVAIYISFGIFIVNLRTMGLFDIFRKKKALEGGSPGDGSLEEVHSDDAPREITVGRPADFERSPSAEAAVGSPPDRVGDEVEQGNEPGTDHGQSGGYLGNLEHTAVIDALLRVPRAERGEEWIVNFLSHVATASFRCGDPQIIQGPDGFPYFQIFLPEANKAFQCYVIEHMLDDFLLENGFGVALEPKEGQVEWVLTYGDLLHYAVHRTFAIPNDHLFGKSGETDEIIERDEEVLVGAPSEEILPKRARMVIKSFLQAQGVKEPKVCLIDRSAAGKGQDLVFNLVPWEFENHAHYRAVMQALGWFLPGYYSYIGAQEKTFQDLFLPL